MSSIQTINESAFQAASALKKRNLDVGKAKETRDIIKKYERHHSHDLNSYALLGQAESMLGNEIETAILQSEFYYLAGETKLAVEKLKFI